MSKKIYFDMDGTLADFYGVNGWLYFLEKEDTYPYKTRARSSILGILRKFFISYKITGMNWVLFLGEVRQVRKNF